MGRAFSGNLRFEKINKSSNSFVITFFLSFKAKSDRVYLNSNFYQTSLELSVQIY